MHVREMLEKDIDFALGLTSAEGWSNTGLDFEDLLEFDPQACFIAEMDGEPIGMICTVPYDGFGYMSNLIVLEKHRKRGHGTELMEYAIDYLESRNVRTQMLDGVRDAISLYERFGFRRICRSLRLEGRVNPLASENVRFMTDEDLVIINQLDTQLFGASRKQFLHSLLTHFPRLCRVLEVNEEICGYIMGSERWGSIRIGPWGMIEHLGLAEELLRAFSTETGGSVLRIGVLERSQEAVELLQKHNFTQTSYSWRMIRGVDGKWSLSNRLFAIFSPDRG